MQTREWRTTDKTTWGRGPWMAEPDKKQWRDGVTGLPCLAVRNHGGAWCGYVGVPASHPLHGKGYDDVDVEVHGGGLTFAGACADLTPAAHARFRARVTAAQAEAQDFPRGDAAQLIREWAGVIASYPAWLAHAQGRFICHLPDAGEPDDVWWFGFDCAHAYDASPAYRERGLSLAEGEYRDLGYVEREVAALARQLAVERADSDAEAQDPQGASGPTGC